MTEKRFEIKKSMWIADGYVIIDNNRQYTFTALTSNKAINYCRILNLLNDENERLLEENNHLKSILVRLGEMLQFDVDNNIKTYPKVLVEYLANALKVMLNDL